MISVIGSADSSRYAGIGLSYAHRARHVLEIGPRSVPSQPGHRSRSFFALITVWVGVRFYLWVRYFETGGATLRVARPMA